MSDPEWLLSTTAQSSAALVAIVGGFLVSRTVSLAVEREAFRRQRADLERRRSAVDAEAQRIQEVVLSTARQWFVGQNVELVTRAQGQVAPGVVAAHYTPPGAGLEDVAGWAEVLANEVADLFGVAADMPASAFEGAGALRRAAAQRAVDERIVDAIAGHLRGDPVLPVVPIPLDVHDRQLAAIERRRALVDESSLLTAQMQIVDTNTKNLRRPLEVDVGIAVLALLTLSGVVVPVWFLTRRPIPHAAASRDLVFWCFSGGLAALFGYIFWAVRRLRI